MRAEIRANLEREVKVRLSARVKDQMMQALLDTTQVEVPKALIEMEIERLRELTRQDFAARGIQVGGHAAARRDVRKTGAAAGERLGLFSPNW